MEAQLEQAYRELVIFEHRVARQNGNKNALLKYPEQTIQTPFVLISE